MPRRIDARRVQSVRFSHTGVQRGPNNYVKRAQNPRTFIDRFRMISTVLHRYPVQLQTGNVKIIRIGRFISRTIKTIAKVTGRAS